VLVWAREKAFEGAVDEARRCLAERGVIQPDRVECARTEVLDQDVRLCDEAPYEGKTVGGADIRGETALVPAIGREETGAG